MNLNEILAKIPPEALAALSNEEQAFIAKETMDLDSLITPEMTIEEANLLGLRIFSLLSATATEIVESDMSVEFQALSHFEDKDLINLLKKLVKLDCYKLRKRSKIAEEEEEETLHETETEETNPLTTL